MIKKTILRFSIIKPSKNKTLRFYSSFNPKFNSTIELSSVFTSKNDIQSIKLNEFRIKGIKLNLRYYDTHLYDRKIKYEHPICPTLLVLPNGESKIEDLANFIDYFSSQKYRVLVMELPGSIKLHGCNQKIVSI
jgi:hypothetical protein